MQGLIAPEAYKKRQKQECSVNPKCGRATFFSVLIIITAVFTAYGTQQPGETLAQTVPRDGENGENKANVVLLIVTNPSGAQIQINDSVYGLSPVLITDLDTGTFEIDMGKSGHYRRRVRVRIDTYGQRNLNFELQRPATLKVVSSPPGAEVFIDKDRGGTTPFFINQLRPAEYQLRCTLEGYEPAHKQIEVLSGASDTVFFTLEPIAKQQENPPVTFDEQEKDQEGRTDLAEAEKRKGFRANISRIMVIGAFALFGILLFSLEKAQS